MKEIKITGISVEDRRFPLENGAGSDAVHTVPVYAYAVCRLKRIRRWTVWALRLHWAAATIWCARRLNI